MSRFWNRRAAALTPYIPGEQPRVEGLVKLNTNEHPLPPSPKALSALDRISGDALRRYPDPHSSTLRAAVAAAEGVAPDRVFVGNGSDEVLALVFMALLEAQTPLTIPAITYSFYPVWAQLCDITLNKLPLREDFSIDLDALKKAPGPVLIANPNAPTGLALSETEVAALAASQPDRLVVVDEAYFGFGADSAVPLTRQFDNLLVTRTLSKSHALAGLRVGFAIGQPALIEGLIRVKDSFNSYPVDLIAQQVATAAIQDSAWFHDASAQVVNWREALRDSLLALGFECLESRANFLFVQHQKLDGETIFGALRERKVLVRRWSKPNIENWLRITVGNGEENAALVAALQQIINGDESDLA